MSKIDTAKLSALTKEQKLALYDKIQLKKQLDKEKRDAFNPHLGQLPVMLSEKVIRVVTAGNGYGKTALGVNTMLYAVKGYDPIKKKYTKVPTVGVVVLDNPIKVKEVWLKEIAKWYNVSKIEQLKNGKPYVNELVFDNGSRVIFMFHDQEELVFESIEIDWAIYDEPPPRHVFIGLSRGQRTKNTHPWQLIIGTPISAAWIRTDLYEPWLKGEQPDVEFFRGETQQNEQNLAEGYIQRFSRLLSENEKRIRLAGEFFDLGGLALAHLFKDDIHIVKEFQTPQHWPCIVSIDPHPQKKNVALLLAIDPRTNRKYAVKALAEKATAASFAESLHTWTSGFRVVDWVCDSLGSADLTGGDGFKSFIQVLKDYGIRVRATTYEEKKDEEWIERIKSALDIPLEADNFGEMLPNLRVFNTCQELIKDIKNVSWLKYKNLEEHKPKLDISNKDYLACLKYALAVSASIKPIGQEAKPIRLGGQKTAKSVSIRSRYMSRR